MHFPTKNIARGTTDPGYRVSSFHWKAISGDWMDGMGWDICITDSTYYKSTASGANKAQQCTTPHPDTIQFPPTYSTTVLNPFVDSLIFRSFPMRCLCENATYLEFESTKSRKSSEPGTVAACQEIFALYTGDNGEIGDDIVEFNVLFKRFGVKPLFCGMRPSSS